MAHAPVMTDDTRRARWCEAFGAHENSIMVYNDLCTRMSEPQRFYHTLEHVDELLTLATDAGIDSPWLDAAIWFHDAVYTPGDGDNEAASARLATRTMARLSLTDDAQAHVITAIHASKDHKSTDPDVMAFLDLDMAILGSPPGRYIRYAADVRREFGHISDWRFGMGRKQFLKGCLKRKHIYLTPWFHERFEAQARANMQAELKGFS
ncbi:HD domain-containing protein [Kordiimonas aestuarii]|uniref:HD domain-containing protein n=1 Tax=Kordiimonas aestuarii TaxID=1005925 RepID=UPI0021D08F91|nr:hypothetical protein [Kordiimonas aestuarii]